MGHSPIASVTVLGPVDVRSSERGADQREQPLENLSHPAGFNFEASAKPESSTVVWGGLAQLGGTHQ